MVLSDLSDRIDEEFYRIFPNQRPFTDEEIKKMREEDDRLARLHKEQDDAFLASLSPEELKRVLGERQAEARRQAKASDRYWRDADRRASRLFDDSGFSAGRDAADELNLNRNAHTVGSSDRKELG